MNRPNPIARRLAPGEWTTPQWRRWTVLGRWLLLAAVTGAIWLSSLFLLLPPDTTLDSSWQFAINTAWKDGWVYGRDVVFTYGPWGWLTMVFYDADTFAGRIGWEIGWKLIAAVLAVLLARGLPWPRRVLLLTATLLLLPVFGDNPPFLVIMGLTLWSARATRPPPALLVAASALLGLLALEKFTFFVLVAAGLVLATVSRLMERDRRSAAWIAGSGAGSILAWWLAAGQPLAALPLFLQRSAWISSGYTEAMFVYETPLQLRLGLACAALALFVIWETARWRRLPVALMLTFFGFVSWKHGFVRADGHMLGFFSLMIFAGLAAPQLNPSKSLRLAFASWTLCAVGLAGAIAAVPGVMSRLHHLLRAHLVENSTALLSLSRHRAGLEQRAAAAAADNALPAVRAAVGSATIDQFGYGQAMLMFNHLTYRPRPVLQGYQTYNGPLAQLNEDFYRSARAPAYTLARLETIDNRLSAMDDARLLPRLLTDHDYVLAENGFLLLRRRASPAPLALRPLQSGQLRNATETLDLPVTTTAIWARIDPAYSWIGWLRTLLYKPPEVTLAVTDAGGLKQRFRVVAPATRAGFLLSPILHDTNELEQLLTRHHGRATRRLRIEFQPEATVFFRPSTRYELFSIPDLPFDAGPR